MYIYVKASLNEPTWETGYYLTKYSHDGRPYIQFFPESAWDTPDEAAARVNYLNGGTGHPSWMSKKKTEGMDATEMARELVKLQQENSGAADYIEEMES